LFLTLSGSRRNYYVLPLVPFAILMTADWLLAAGETARRNVWAKRLAVIFFILLFLVFDVIQPFYYAGGGEAAFAKSVIQRANQIKPWSQWNFVLLDPESKVRFYLALPPETKNYSITGDQRKLQTQASLLAAWPSLRHPDSHTIYISRKLYEPILRGVFKNHEEISAHPGLGAELVKKKDSNLSIAFIPVQAK
jgi:hypothetical protein